MPEKTVYSAADLVDGYEAAFVNAATTVTPTKIEQTVIVNDTIEMLDKIGVFFEDVAITNPDRVVESSKYALFANASLKKEAVPGSNQIELAFLFMALTAIEYLRKLFGNKTEYTDLEYHMAVTEMLMTLSEDKRYDEKGGDGSTTISLERAIAMYLLQY